MMPKKIIFQIVLVLFCVFAGISEAANVRTVGDSLVVEAEGYAPVIDGNKNRAREEAKRSAYRDALEKALGATVSGITEMQNYEVVKDKVFSQTAGIVKGLDIVSEKIDEDGVLRISAVCKVSVAALDGVLGPVVINALGNPRIMILIDERIGDKAPFISATESETLRVFEKAGYLIVDPDQARALISIDPSEAYNDPSKLMEIARTLRADVIILGKAYGNSFYSGKVEGIRLHGVSSTVQLKAVLTQTAYQISSKTVSQSTGKKPALSVAEGATRCFKQATEIASKELVHKIAYALISGSPGGVPGITVNIKILGISFKKAEELGNVLRDVSGTSGGVYERAYKDGALELDVVSEKTARNIATILSDNGIEIDSVTTQTIKGKASSVVSVADTDKHTIGVTISEVSSLKEFEELEKLLLTFIGETGTIREKGYKDKVVVFVVVSEKTAMNIASFLSEKKLEIQSVTTQSVEGKMDKKSGVWSW